MGDVSFRISGSNNGGVKCHRKVLCGRTLDLPIVQLPCYRSRIDRVVVAARFLVV